MTAKKARDDRPKTIGELQRSGYRVLSVREELRKNLIAKLENGQELFSGIIGFEDTALPQLENAILAGQDIIVLGERGQAKSRIIRQLVTLLDDKVPIISGCEVNDDPYSPICRRCKDKVNDEGTMWRSAGWPERDDMGRSWRLPTSPWRI